MIIKYGCATLRPIEEKDFDLLYFMINDPEIEESTVGWHYPISVYQQKEFMKNWKNDETGIRLMIDLSNGKTIGMIGVESIDWKNRTAVTGYKISAKAEDRIRGDMMDAVIGLNNYLFNELGINCIHGEILEENVFAQKLSKKLFGKVEGILRQRLYKNGRYHNVLAVSTLKDEFNEGMKTLKINRTKLCSNKKDI